MPICRVVRKTIHDVIHSNIELGQKNPNIPVEELFPNVSNVKIR